MGRLEDMGPRMPQGDPTERRRDLHMRRPPPPPSVPSPTPARPLDDA